MMRRILATLGAAALLLPVAACGGQTQSVSGGSGGDNKTITLGAVAFDESVASTYLWKELLEQQGYTVKVDTLDVAPVYAGVASGQLDASMALSKTFQADYWNKYDKDFTPISNWYHGVSQAVAVPKSLGITSMNQLASKASVLGDRIVGIEAGSGLMGDLHSKAVSAYHLQKFKIIDGSTPAMLAALDKATKEHQPIAVTLWQPHWALSKYPVVILKDPKGVFGGVGDLTAIANNDFVKTHPKVANEMAKFKMTPEQLQSLELKINQAGEGKEQDAVKAWLKSNQSVVDAWTSSSGS